LKVGNAKHCGLGNSRRGVVAKLIEDPRLQINREPREAPRERKELATRVMREVELARLEVAADAVIVFDLWLGQNGLVEPAEPLLRVSVWIAICGEVNTVTAIERSFTVWHTRILENVALSPPRWEQRRQEAAD
jgi:hypothetical protein